MLDSKLVLLLLLFFYEVEINEVVSLLYDSKNENLDYPADPLDF